MKGAGLTVADLHSEREARARVNHETYKQLLAQVQDRIKLRATNDFRDLMWQVPPLVPGRPVYTPSHAARYVSEKLRRGGFDVNVATPGADVYVLYITWAATTPARPTRRGRDSREHRPRPAQASKLPLSVEEATHRLERLKARLRT